MQSSQSLNRAGKEFPFGVPSRSTTVGQACPCKRTSCLEDVDEYDCTRMVEATPRRGLLVHKLACVCLTAFPICIAFTGVVGLEIEAGYLSSTDADSIGAGLACNHALKVLMAAGK